jgi:hypothetical protein
LGERWGSEVSGAMQASCKSMKRASGLEPKA